MNEQLTMLTENAPTSSAKTKNINIVRIMAVKEKSLKYGTDNIKNPETAIDLARLYFEERCNNDRENFLIMCLDAKNKITALNLNSTGTLNSTIVHPREVFKAAILANTAAIILAHNHPSGDPNPSREDIDLTNRLAEAGKILGIEILDHIIIGDGNSVSLKAKGLIH